MPATLCDPSSFFSLLARPKWQPQSDHGAFFRPYNCNSCDFLHKIPFLVAKSDSNRLNLKGLYRRNAKDGWNLGLKNIEAAVLYQRSTTGPWIRLVISRKSRAVVLDTSVTDDNWRCHAVYPEGHWALASYFIYLVHRNTVWLQQEKLQYGWNDKSHVLYDPWNAEIAAIRGRWLSKLHYNHTDTHRLVHLLSTYCKAVRITPQPDY